MKRREFLGTVAAGMAVAAVPAFGSVHEEDRSEAERRVRAIALDLTILFLNREVKGLPLTWDKANEIAFESVRHYFPKQADEWGVKYPVYSLTDEQIGVSISPRGFRRPVCYMVRWDRKAIQNGWEIDRCVCPVEIKPGHMGQIEYCFDRRIA